MDVYRLGVKVFAANPEAVRLDDFIPIFHGWIQKQSLDRHLLIDVHDYSHMHQGPGILLVAHEGNFSVDMSDGRPGLLYFRKAPSTLPPAEHVATILKSALQAVRLLEKDTKIRFSMDELVIIANDRLAAPNDDKTLTELQPILMTALKQVIEKPDFTLTRASKDPRERFAVKLKTSF